MVERRALLDPKMYKISEEDSQDEEVLSGMNTLDLNPRVVGTITTGKQVLTTLPFLNGRKNFPGSSRLESVKEQCPFRRVRWPALESDSDSQSSEGGDTDDSRESECWTCSSEAESGDETWSSSSSSSSRTSSSEVIPDQNQERGMTPGTTIRDFPHCSTFSHHFLRYGKKGKARDAPGSNYSLSRLDIESNMDEEGNLRLIEYYPSEEECEFGDETSLGRPDSGMESGRTFSDSPSLQTRTHGKRETLSERRKIQVLLFLGGGRISRFLGRKPDKRSKGSGRSKIKGNEEQATTSSPGDTRIFPSTSRHDGVTRHVTLNLNTELRRPLGNSLLESFLGIIPEKRPSFEHFPPEDQNIMDRKGNQGEITERIIIQGFVPNSPAARARHLRIGDWVRTINGIVVSPLNVEFILSAIQHRHPRGHSPGKQEIKVTLSTLRSHESKEKYGEMAIAWGVKEAEVMDSKIETVKEKQDEIGAEGAVEEKRNLPTATSTNHFSPIFVLYVSGKTGVEPESNAQTETDLQYVWPPKESRNGWVEEIFLSIQKSLKMFEALFGALKEASGEKPQTSQVAIGERKMEVSYFSEEKDEGFLIVLSIIEASAGGSHRISSGNIITLITKILTFKWGFLKSAFETSNQGVVNRLFGKLFHQSSIRNSESFQELPILIQIPTDQKEAIMEELTELETGAGQIEEADSDEYSSESVLSLGSAVFVKGKLVLSTMRGELLSKSYAWAMSELNWIEEAWPVVKRLLLWQKALVQGPCAVTLIGMDRVFMLSIVLLPLSRRQIRGKVPPLRWLRKGNRRLERIWTILEGEEDSRRNSVPFPGSLDHLMEEPDTSTHSKNTLPLRRLVEPRRTLIINQIYCQGQGRVASAFFNLKRKIFRRREQTQYFAPDNEKNYSGENLNKQSTNLRKSTSRQTESNPELPSPAWPLESCCRVPSTKDALHFLQVDAGRGYRLIGYSNLTSSLIRREELEEGIAVLNRSLKPNEELGFNFKTGSNENLWIVGRADNNGTRTFVALVGEHAGTRENLSSLFEMATEACRK